MFQIQINSSTYICIQMCFCSTLHTSDVDVTNDVRMNYKESIDANPIIVNFSSTIQCRKWDLGCSSLVRSNW